MTSQVLLIHAGATAYDDENRVQGVLSIPLSERGKAEVARLSEQLDTLELTALYYGPGEHVQQTADVLGRSLGLRPRRIAELSNLDQGLWQGLQTEEIKRRNPKLFRQWLDEPRTVCPPMGETIEAALERVRSALRPVIRRHRQEMIGLVVPDPIAQIIAAYLRKAPRLQLEEISVTGEMETIEVAPELIRNGDHE